MIVARAAAVSAMILYAVTAQAAPAQNGYAQVLMTPQYKITITSPCVEGVVVCDELIYTGVNIRTGQTITLKGRDFIHICSDGVTPCDHLGYEFRSGNVVYFVSDDGLLTVTRGHEEILSEQGTWQ